MVKYYSDRASAGIVIAEATMVNAEAGSAFNSEPGIYSDEQVAGWKEVADAVHAKGGKFVVQIYQPGRAAHSAINDGVQPVSATDVGCTGHGIQPEFTATGEKTPYEAPRALADDELPKYQEYFVQAAKNAIKAGADGVEVHLANGYLLDQFLRTNTRTGAFGGSMEKRALFPLAVVKAVCDAIGADRVGVRISPLNSYQSMADEDPAALTAYVSEKLSDLNIAYLHLMRADFFGIQKADVVPIARKHFKGVLVANMGYEAAEAEAAIAAGQLDAVAFGIKFLANPDFPQRVKVGAELNALKPKNFYTLGHEGYNDYASMQ
jgi:N-ethylmaleimide reductase